ncbi:kinesin-like protein KIF26B [Chanos chanos]|uniref:Kinesin-like protein KIF26B n=1 Tax=Chanos chanos TaxID=29144 RepID=A0A6J2V4V1_CHACN|nr:kinesin-like protein KIF26B [Chanos chanos]
MEKISSSSGSSGSPRYLVTGVQTGSLSSKRLCHAVRMKTPLERLPPEGAGSTIGSKQPRDSPCRGPEYSSASLCLPVSDKGILCEKCIAQLEVLKEKTHSLLVPRDVASKDPKFGTFQLPVGATETWDEPGPLCDICGTHLSQLKQAAVHMVLTQEHAIWASPSSANIFTNSPASGVHTFPRISTSHSGPSEPRRVPGNLGMEKWVKGNQHLEVTSQSNGITVLPHEVSSEERKGKKKGAMPSAALCHLGTHLPSLPPRVSALLPMGTSAAVSFFVRAAQKLNLTTRRRRQGDESDLTTCQSNFSSILQTAPPPVPPSLFQVLNKGKESSGMGKVKVMLRVCPSFMEDSSQSHCFKLDTQKKQVTVLDPLSHVSLKTAGITFSPKTFTFDAVFSQETSQAEVCEGTLSEVLKSVIGGADGCIFSFGHTKVGTYYTMIGYDDCTQNLGIIPSAITWLFKLINKKKEKMGVNISVHISALEVCGKNEVLKDLLSGVDSGDLPDSHKPNVYLLEDPLSGIQLCNQSLQCASTAERAAYLLDVALTSRISNVPGCSSVPKNSSHMFFTFHILQNHLDSSIKAAIATLSSFVSYRDSKLAMLLQESMGNINCHTVMIAHISASYGDLSESLCTIQIMSRLRREQKKAKKSASCSPRGRSMGRERKMHQSNGLRTFQLGDNVDHNLSLPQLCDLGDCYGSDKSCDTVVHVDPNGWVLPDKAVTSKTKAFVPIIPSLHTNKAETEKSLFSVQNEVSQPIETHVMRRQTEKEKNKQNQLPVANEGPSKPHQDCLKCNTFAELQERLYCIDGSELVSMSADALIKSEPMPSLTNGKEINRTATAMSARQLEIKSESKKDATICNTDKIPSAAHTKDDRLHPTDSQAYFQTQVSLGNQHCPEPFPRNEAPVAMALPLDNQKMFLDDPLLQSDMRISPVGKSSSSSFSSTLSANLTSPVTDPVMCNDVIPQSSTEIPKKEMKAIITITVQHPLDLNGQDELVYTVVEELTIDSGAIERDRSTNIISFNDSRIKSLVSGSQPGRIVSSITEEQKIIDVSSSAMTSDGKPPKPLPNSPAVPPSPRSTLERRQSLTKQCIFAWAKQSLPIPSMWKCSPNQKRTSSMQPSMSSSPEESDMSPLLTARREIGKDSPRSPVEESSRLFSARLEQLTNRSHSLRGSPLDFSDLDSLKKSDSMISLASSGSVEGYCPAGSVDRKSLEQCINMATHGSKGEWDPVMHRLGRSSRRVPKFFPIHDSDRSNSTESCKDNQSKTSDKHVSDPKVHTLPVTCSKDSTFSPKSTKRSLNRSSSLSPNGVSYNRNVWRTQSLTRNQGSGLITKSSQKVMNGRISELLQTSRESLSSRGQMCSDLEENKSSKGKVPLLVHTLPSPYSRITAPRKPNYCSGHASDNTSVLSGELPPAMCKTALLYNRNSMFSSGYESMMRDSEATCSSISTRESISDRSCPLNSSKGAKGSRKRSKTGKDMRRPSQDTLLSLRRSCSGPKVHWVDRGVSDSYEIKVYEIDDVERLQKKGEAGNKGVICFSAKLKFLEHRQQRIAEVRAKYNALKRELEILKQHLMVDPRKWIQEFDLWQTFEVDSLEHLEALELVTERLESRVTRCKARLMMVTCFDVTPKHKGKRRCWQVLDHKGFVGI